jgi:hypothetical protein
MFLEAADSHLSSARFVGRVDDRRTLFIDDQRCDAAHRVLPDMQVRLGSA